MPAFEMPLEKLKEYRGTNPRPSDFDEFWNASLSELDTIDPNVTITAVPFKTDIANCYDLYFTSTKGARVYSKLLIPKNLKGKAPALIQFHGLAIASTDWSNLFCFAAEGFVVAAMDCRGQGGKSTDAGGVPGTTFTTPFMRGLEGDATNLYYRDVFLDTARLAHIVMNLPEVDRTRVATNGGSQGGALALVCAALVPEIRLCSAQYPYLSDYKRIWDMDLDVNSYEGMRYYFRSFDQRHERETEIFTKLGYIDVQNLAPRIKAKVLMYTGLMDTTCPPSTQFAVYNKIESEKKMIIYPDYGHEYTPSQRDTEFEFLSSIKD
jgi:cephalosporin-C deacetylase